MRRRLILTGLALVVATGAAIWGVARLQYRAELSRADREMASGQFATAAARLEAICRRWPGRGKAEYSLGACLEAVGRVDEALAAWGRLAPGSPFGPEAAMRRARLAQERGRLATAEESLNAVLGRSDGPVETAEGMLASLYWLSGRADEAARRLRARWKRPPGRAESLRTHWMYENEAFPAEGIRAFLETAGREAPDDDRVWLGRADLATRSGRLDEADGWLARCEARRPDDPAVRRARLAWALAADRPDEIVRAAARLPADQLAMPEILAIRARLDAQRGDRPAERAALSDLLDLRPGDSRALERLAELATEARQPDEAARLRHRKAEVDRLKERYRKLLSGDPAMADPAELGRLAEGLGRWFETDGWWSLQASRRGGDPEARAARVRIAARLAADRPPPGKTLADLLPPVAPGTRRQPAGPGVDVPTFADLAEPSGLRFVHESGRTPLRQLPETMGGGVGLIDVDGDGWLDVYAIQGGPFPPPPGAANGDRLFRNTRDGRFEDVTAKAGLAALRGGYGHGLAVGDFDNDGHADLFVTRWRSYALYRNRGDGTFEDATERAGLGGPRDWPTSAAFADLDNDGDLDLYVCHYLDWDPERSQPCRRPGSAENSYCDPREFVALPDHLFRNDGGRFVDVTAEAGIVDRDGRGLGVVAADLDGDGKVDLFVANDTTANYLFRNLGGLKFREEGLEAGVATNASGGYLAGMGTALGDLDGDGLPDLAVTNFYGESTTLYRNNDKGRFSDRTAAVGLALPSRFLLGFGAAMFDANNDGRLDLATANGHVSDFRPAVPYAMPARLYLGGPGGRLDDVSGRAGPPWSVPRLGRGLAVGDLDNDGFPDLVLAALDAPLAYFHNNGMANHHSLTIRLEGRGSNRDGVGAVVRATSGGTVRVAQRFGGGSYLSAGDSRIHFGLGTAKTVDRVVVTWPSGRMDRFEGLQADAGYLIREGDPTAKPMPGPFRPRDLPPVAGPP